MAAQDNRKVIRCECGKRLKVDPNLVGRRAQCPFCKKEFFVPKITPDPFAGLRPDASLLMFWKKKPSGEDRNEGS